MLVTIRTCSCRSPLRFGRSNAYQSLLMKRSSNRNRKRSAEQLSTLEKGSDKKLDMDKTYAIRSSTENNMTLNILPCRIQREGSTKISERYWKPKDDSRTTKTAHFRGRRLKGKHVQLPKNYRGVGLVAGEKVLLESETRAAQTTLRDQEEEEEEEEEEEDLSQPTITHIVEQVCAFDTVVVYDHDRYPAADDEFIKGIEEWISLAETIHKD